MESLFPGPVSLQWPKAGYTSMASGFFAVHSRIGQGLARKEEARGSENSQETTEQILLSLRPKSSVIKFIIHLCCNC